MLVSEWDLLEKDRFELHSRFRGGDGYAGAIGIKGILEVLGRNGIIRDELDKLNKCSVLSRYRSTVTTPSTANQCRNLLD